MSPLDEFLDGAAAGSPVEKEKKLAAYRELVINSDRSCGKENCGATLKAQD